ncbi:MAG: AIR carboxylase family protein [Candidatus Moranbacteria bacterium]|nr:AIR carboxylase family protein [Candidatus Moranbacteria bacterium]
MIKRISIIIGSKSDLPQCKDGLEYLSLFIRSGEVILVEFDVASIHRNTEDVLKIVYDLVENQGVNCLIVGAGMANHLTGTIDAFLRYTMKNDSVLVYGVAFEGKTPQHLLAAKLSIIEVPGTQVIFDFDNPTFLAACEKMVGGEIPEIKIGQPRKVEKFYSIEDVLNLVNEPKA